MDQGQRIGALQQQPARDEEVDELLQHGSERGHALGADHQSATPSCVVDRDAEAVTPLEQRTEPDSALPGRLRVLTVVSVLVRTQLELNDSGGELRRIEGINEFVLEASETVPPQ